MLVSLSEYGSGGVDPTCFPRVEYVELHCGPVGVLGSYIDNLDG